MAASRRSCRRASSPSRFFASAACGPSSHPRNQFSGVAGSRIQTRFSGTMFANLLKTYINIHTYICTYGRSANGWYTVFPRKDGKGAPTERKEVNGHKKGHNASWPVSIHPSFSKEGPSNVIAGCNPFQKGFLGIVNTTLEHHLPTP